ncbi:Nose resistant to fluoxetine protein 6 [Halotydeus destructor]|nr:Nose resistant to fluoxetine protein 6 [Halotydeus destructor]
MYIAAILFVLLSVDSGQALGLSANASRMELVSHMIDGGHLLSMKVHSEFKAGTGEFTNDTVIPARVRWLAAGGTLLGLVNDLVMRSLPKVAEVTFKANLSLACTSGLLMVATAARQGTPWVFRMADATGTLSPGLLDGSITSLGAYDECLGIRSPRGDVEGKYCLVKWSLPLPVKPKHVTLQDRVLDFKGTKLQGTVFDDMAGYAHAFYERSGRNGLCVPSKCSKEDVDRVLDYFLKDTGLEAHVARCETARDSFEFKGYHFALMGSLFAILFLVVAGSLVDLTAGDEKPGPLVRVLKAFSPFANGASLGGSRDSGIGCIHGLRCISMAWILYTHTYLVTIKETFSFSRHFMYAVEGTGFQLVLNGWVLVDTFFVIGAALSCLATFKTLDKVHRVNFVTIIANRLARLTPMLYFTLALCMLVPALGSGPLWWEYWRPQVARCESNYWATMLYVNNWLRADAMCYLPSWYLAADFQLFVLGVFLSAILWRFTKVAVWAVAGLALGSAVAVGTAVGLTGLPPTVMYNTPTESEVDDATSSIYTPTYVHLAPYCVGLLLGLALHQLSKRKMVISRATNLTLWCLSLAAMLLILTVTQGWNQGSPWTSWSAALYGGSHRLAWSLAVSWVIFACASGHGGAVDSFLSWKLFTPLSKLSFAVYLLHFIVLWARYASIRWTLPFGHYSMLCEFIVNYVLSTIMAAIAFLCVEVPFGKLYKMATSDGPKWSDVHFEKTNGSQPLDHESAATQGTTRL